MDTESTVSQVQRKIELQSPQDLAFLVANVRSAAAARINEAFPQVDSSARGEDELRNQIESLVDEYITKTFSLAAPNLSINGLPVSSSSLTSSAASQSTAAAAATAYEPFDAERRQRVADLITQEEKLLEEVAALKRSVPGQAASEAATRVGDAIRRDEELLQARETQLLAMAREEGGKLAVEKGQRQQSIEEGFATAVEALGRLKRDMPAVVARMERARVAGEYVAEGK